MSTPPALYMEYGPLYLYLMKYELHFMTLEAYPGLTPSPELDTPSYHQVL